MKCFTKEYNINHEASFEHPQTQTKKTKKIKIQRNLQGVVKKESQNNLD